MNTKNTKKKNGFILIEICIALILFALLLTLSSFVTKKMTQHYQKIKNLTLKNIQLSQGYLLLELCFAIVILGLVAPLTIKTWLTLHHHIQHLIQNSIALSELRYLHSTLLNKCLESKKITLLSTLQLQSTTIYDTTYRLEFKNKKIRLAIGQGHFQDLTQTLEIDAIKFSKSSDHLFLEIFAPKISTQAITLNFLTPNL
jgi:type II secretory pathway component PulJ